MSDIRTGLANVAVHLAHDTNMLVTVQQRVLLVATGTAASAGSPVGLQAGIGENDNQTLGVLVLGRDGNVLLSHQLRQLGRGAGLGP